MYYYTEGELSNLLNLYYKEFNTDILKGIESFKKDEQLYNFSCKQYVLMQYQLAFMLAQYLVYYIRYNNVSYLTLVQELDMQPMIDNLACNNIKWDDILTALNIDINSGEGINHMELSETFIVGGGYITPTEVIVDYTTWKQPNQTCLNLIP